MRVWASLIVLLWARAGLPAATELKPGTPVAGTLAPGAVVEYVATARLGQRIHLTLKQLRLEAVLQVVGPSGAVLGKVTNNGQRPDPLTLTVLTTEAGVHRIDVRLEKPGSPPGAFRLTLDPMVAATDPDRQRIRAETLRNEADRLVAAQDPKGFKAAVPVYEQSEDLWRKLNEPLELASTLTQHGEVLARMGEFLKAKELLTEALPLWRRMGEPDGEVDCLDWLGVVLGHSGEPRQGLALLEQALALRRKLGPEPYGEGSILNDMAVVYSELGDFPRASEKYQEALPLAEQSGDAVAVAQVKLNRAVCLAYVGQSERSRVEMTEAKERFHALHRPNEEGSAEYQIGNTYRVARDYPNALLHYRTALTLLESVGNKRFAALTLQNIGLVGISQHRYDDATRAFELAREMAGAGDVRALASAKVDLARVLVERGRSAEGVKALRAARKDLQQVGHQSYERVLLTWLAKGELALGSLEDAHAHILEALDLTEKLRSTLSGPTARAAYLAVEYQQYQVLVEVLMDLHAREPRHGWDAEALGASETARARSLLEAIAEGPGDVDLDVDPALRKSEQDIDARMELKRREQQTLLAKPHSTEAADALEQAIGSLRLEREGVEERMRASSPAYASLTQARPLSLQQIRAQLLDESTALVEYLLGETRSFVWVVTPKGITSATLPSRAAIEKAALAVQKRWSDPAATDDGQVQARALATQVLAPVARALTSKRLMIVADGALELIPFAALPEPTTGRALIDTHEVVAVPSASVLAMLRTRHHDHAGTGSVVAVLADPVVSRSDARLSSPGAVGVAALSPNLVRSLEDAGLGRLERLPGSAAEAAAIAAHAGDGKTFSALGFQASRAVAMGSEVGHAEIVHFASHALTDARRPELSGIVLSLFDLQGQPQDGFLSLADIYRLRLDADLVVLSACRTGLGKEVRGEGAVGLTRAFMFAGAPRVVASGWKVSDRATAALMDRFYALLLVDHQAPAAALRSAQLALKKERRFSTPYAWAGFVLHGDWGPIAASAGASGSESKRIAIDPRN